MKNTPRKEKAQNCLRGEKARPFSFRKTLKEASEGKNKMSTEASKAKTPPPIYREWNVR